nr:reverse transcriptase domain-containing protein [Tanacetum cinerariifolium]
PSIYLEIAGISPLLGLGVSGGGGEDDSKDTPMEADEELSDPWTLFTDGSSCIDGFGDGLILINQEGVEFTYTVRFRFDETNNEAEYEALISGLRIVKQMGEIISDNEKQFRDNPFKDWCEKLCIRQRFASVKHPQGNGLVERINKSLGEGIKARLDERSKDWIEEIPHVLWAHRTMIKSSNADTPFSLTYRTKAVIPIEIERREQAVIREARSKAKMEKYYNYKVRNTSFKPGDLVYQNNDASHAKDSGKLSPKWEGS